MGGRFVLEMVTLSGVMAVILRYFTKVVGLGPITSQWLKLHSLSGTEM